MQWIYRSRFIVSVPSGYNVNKVQPVPELGADKDVGNVAERMKKCE